MENKISFLNIEVSNVTMEETLVLIGKFIREGGYHYIVTPNIDHIVKLEKDEQFKEVYRNANLVLMDSQPLMWVSKMKKKPIKEKISGSDLFPKLCHDASKNGYKVFLLGASEGVADEAARKLKKKYSGLNIVGTCSPSYGFENNEQEVDEIIGKVNAAKPDILAVGLGAPKQEKFIYQYKERLKVPVTVAIGASIDFEAGKIKRAPVWMQKSGLEWFYRFLKEPSRLFKRYFVDGVRIIGILFKY